MSWVADKQKFISHHSGGWEVQNYGTERFNVCLRCAFPLKAIFSLLPHMVKDMIKLSVVTFIRALILVTRAGNALHPTPVHLPGKSHGRRSLVGCSPWGREESNMTERLHFHFPLLCIGEGNGNPLQCSCLENPRDGVAQSRTQLKWLSSSSNPNHN